ncbi:MAG: hypothetical protein QP780_02800 [Brevibacterium sp. UMB1308B]|nr:hypothetical protein [Brevibacterium sp. UMB1308B]
MSSTGVVLPRLQTTVGLEVLTSRRLRALPPATLASYAADARVWLTYVASNKIDLRGHDRVGWASTSLRARVEYAGKTHRWGAALVWLT